MALRLRAGIRAACPAFGSAAEAPRNLSAELKELEWKRRFTAEPLVLTWDMLRTMIDYDVEKSRFYTGQGRKDLQAYAPKVVALVDGYLSKSEDVRLLERFMPREKKSAGPCSAPLYMITSCMGATLQ